MAGFKDYVAADGAPLGKVQTASGACCNQRAAITNAAGPLGSFVVTAKGTTQSGIPYLEVSTAGGIKRVFPKAVNIQIEAGQSAAFVYITRDGHDTAIADVSATLGMNLVPVAPNWFRLPVDLDPTQGENSTGLVRCIASVASVNVQLDFEF